MFGILVHALANVIDIVKQVNIYIIKIAYEEKR